MSSDHERVISLLRANVVPDTLFPLGAQAMAGAGGTAFPGRMFVAATVLNALGRRLDGELLGPDSLTTIRELTRVLADFLETGSEKALDRAAELYLEGGSGSRLH